MLARTILLCLVFTTIGAVGARLVLNRQTASQSGAGSLDEADAPRQTPTTSVSMTASRAAVAEVTDAVSTPLAAVRLHKSATETPSPIVDGLTPDERVNIHVYETVNRGVVNITTKSIRGDPFFFMEAPSEGSGSGSVFDRQGHILTNFHVIDGARQVHVTLYNGQEYPAVLVGHDVSTDIAVLKIDAPAESLFPLVLGDSSRLRVGQRVFAIGNPFGLERTLTTGVISSLNRSISSRNRRKIKSIIQTDAAINPGNSGGPLLGSNTQLIGMNTAIASRTGQSAGVGFAIPAGTIARIVPQLIEHGRVARADIGIGRVLESDQGLLVVAVTKDGPAEQAGIQGFRLVRERRERGGFVELRTRVDRSTADLIKAVDGQKVVSAEQFLTLIEAKKPGDQVKISLVRKGKPLELTVTLAGDES